MSSPIIIHKTHVLSIEQDTFTLPSGKQVDRTIIRHPGAALIVPIGSFGVRLVKQYRYAVADTLYEIPAGTLEVNEAPLVCAKRELAEEAKLQAARWIDLGVIYPTPGFCDEKQYVYAALDLSASSGDLDDDEELTHLDVSFTELRKLLKQGSITDAKTLGALLLASAKELIPPLL